MMMVAQNQSNIKQGRVILASSLCAVPGSTSRLVFRFVLMIDAGRAETPRWRRRLGHMRDERDELTLTHKCRYDKNTSKNSDSLGTVHHNIGTVHHKVKIRAGTRVKRLGVNGT